MLCSLLDLICTTPHDPNLPHLIKQNCCPRKCIPDQIIMSQNHRNTRMSRQIITLCLHIQLIYIPEYRVNVILQCLQSVLKVVIMILLFGGFVVCLAGLVKLTRRVGIVGLEKFVEEDVPYFWSDFTSLVLEQKVLVIK